MRSDIPSPSHTRQRAQSVTAHPMDEGAILTMLRYFAVIQRTPRGFRYERFGGIVHLDAAARAGLRRSRSGAAAGVSASHRLWAAPEDEALERGAAVGAARGAPAADQPLRRRLPGLLHRRDADGRRRRVGPRRVEARDRRAGRARRVPPRARRRRVGAAAVARRGRRARARARPRAQPDDVAGCTATRSSSGWSAGRRCSGRSTCRIDGVGEDYARVRGFDGFARADRAVVALRRRPSTSASTAWSRATASTGSGACSPTRKSRKLREVELLALQAVGARLKAYEALRCTDEQHRALVPTILKLARKHRLRVRLDCSYTPMVAHHASSRRLMRWLAIYGCAGGDFLVGAKASGVLTACSFAPPVEARGRRARRLLGARGRVRRVPSLARGGGGAVPLVRLPGAVPRRLPRGDAHVARRRERSPIPSARA